MSDRSLARFVERRTTYPYAEALRRVREANPAILKLKAQFGWSWEQSARRLVIERWATERTGRPATPIACEQCSAPDYDRGDGRGGSDRSELCRVCRPLTDIEACEVYAAAAAANFHLVVELVGLERAVRAVVREARELPDLSDVPSAVGWDRYRQRELLWEARGVTHSTEDVPRAWDELLRESGAPSLVVRGGADRPALDHAYAISTRAKPRLRGIVGGLYYDRRLQSLIREVGDAVRFADKNGLCVIVGAYSTWYPRHAIRVEVVGPRLSKQVHGRKAHRP